MGLNYYHNLDAADFEDLPLGSMFSTWKFWYLPTHFDLYFVGAKVGETKVILPSDEEIRILRLTECRFQTVWLDFQCGFWPKAYRLRSISR